MGRTEMVEPQAQQSSLSTAIQHDGNYNPYPQRNLGFHLAIVSICLVCLASTIDLVILASALPVVASSMGATSTQAYWCGTGLLLSQAISQPVYCAFQNIVGHKECMIVAICIFGVASILCATAQDIVWLIAGRVGMGIGGCNAMVNVLVADLTPIAVRGAYLGITQLTAAVGLVAGIVMGAALSTLSTWRLIFWVNLPICVLSALGIFIFIPKPRSLDDKTPLRQSIKSFDLGGVIILAGSLLALLYGVTAGGTLWPWASAQIISSLVIGVVGTGVFAVYETRVAQRPMIEIRLFTDRTVSSGFFTAWAHGVIDIALAYYLILYFLIARLHSLLRSSVDITPGLACIPFWAAVIGYGMAYTSRFKPFNLVSWLFLSAGVGALASLRPDSPLGASYGFQLLLAVGSGGLYPGRILAVQAPLQGTDGTRKSMQYTFKNTEELVSVATTLVSVFTSIGNAFGVGLGSTIVQNRWDKLVSAAPVGFQIPSSSLESSLQIINANQWPSSTIAFYQDLICDSLKVLWIFAGALGLFAFTITCLQRDIRLDKGSSSDE
ncbi:major facilitator superfamily domain-containing protein [Xylariales sp. PMI_506]|nr:major facilitator superfamily domain-containing protein [Xylariales sp. PMI_506]